MGVYTSRTGVELLGNALLGIPNPDSSRIAPQPYGQKQCKEDINHLKGTHFYTIKMWLLPVCFAALSPHLRFDGNGSRGKIPIKVSPFNPRFTGNSGRDNFSLFWPDLNHFSLLFFFPSRKGMPGSESLSPSAEWEKAVGSGHVLSAEQLRHSAHGWWWISLERSELLPPSACMRL